jgi:hypothetical protein
VTEESEPPRPRNPDFTIDGRVGINGCDCYGRADVAPLKMSAARAENRPVRAIIGVVRKLSWTTVKQSCEGIVGEFVIPPSVLDWLAELWRLVTAGRVPDWALGAFTAGLVGYGTDSLRRRHERRTKRRALLQMLANETRAVNPISPPIELSQYNYRMPISVPSLSLILQSDVLSYQSEQNFIRVLIRFRVSIERYNELVGWINMATNLLAQNIVQRHKNMLNDLEKEHDNVHQIRDEVLSIIEEQHLT